MIFWLVSVDLVVDSRLCQEPTHQQGFSVRICRGGGAARKLDHVHVHNGYGNDDDDDDDNYARADR